MIEIHPDLLWLGNALEAREPKQLFDRGIRAVVDVALEETPATLPRSLVYCRFPLNDGGGNDKALLLQTVQTIADLLCRSVPTLIACSAGMSRSPTLAAFALAAHLDVGPAETLERISASKSLETASRQSGKVAVGSNGIIIGDHVPGGR